MNLPVRELYIGLMSGTSLDGVDGVLCDLSGSQPEVLAHVALPFSSALRTELLTLNTPGQDELHRAAIAANGLARTYVAVVARLLAQTATPTSAVKAIGAHGQTVRHQPGLHDDTGYTWQLNNPSLLAEHTGIDVVADFRSRDIAAGGQGAPLVPAFHQGLFGRTGQTVLVLNLGGIANVSVLPKHGPVIGFDCGPGNALLDYWCEQHTGKPFDDQGRWAAQGQVHAGLLAELLAEPFLHQPHPKSTGRDLFNPQWLQPRLAAHAGLEAVDVQATLTAFTARACALALAPWSLEASPLLVCGGGALNTHLMLQLQTLLPQLTVTSTAEHGLPPLQVEATAFAWLARQTLLRRPGNLPQVTGARGLRILGAVYPA